MKTGEGKRRKPQVNRQRQMEEEERKNMSAGQRLGGERLPKAGQCVSMADSVAPGLP